MNKKRKTFFQKISFAVTLFYISASLIIPLVHHSELFHSNHTYLKSTSYCYECDCCHVHAAESHSFCKSFLASASSHSPVSKHDESKCAICLYVKYMLGVKYFSELPDTVDALGLKEKFFPQPSGLLSGIILFRFNSRAPPV